MKLTSNNKREILIYDCIWNLEKFNCNKKKLHGTLSFTGGKLMDAIVSAGMIYIWTRRTKEIVKRSIYFKIKLFETYMLLYRQMENFILDPARKVYLDSTEIGAINIDWNDTYYGTWKKIWLWVYGSFINGIKLSSQPPIEKHRFSFS